MYSITVMTKKMFTTVELHENFRVFFVHFARSYIRDRMCEWWTSYGIESRYNSSEYHVPPAGSF